MEKFFSAVQNMFKIPELRKRILFTLGLLAVYRLLRTFRLPESIRLSSRGFGAKLRVRCSAFSTCFPAAIFARSRFLHSA